MIEFHSTINGRTYYENHVPRIATALEKIAVELEKLNEDKVRRNVSNLEQEDLTACKTLEQVASDIETFEPTLARLLREYI